MDWNQPTSFQLEALHEALLFAYPGHLDFEAMMTLRLGRSYAALAPVLANYENGLLAVLVQAKAGGWLDHLVRTARKHKDKSPKLLLLDRTAELTSVDVPNEIGLLEDIVRNDGGFQDLITWIEKIEALGQRTCRIECPVNSACGTGWLVGPDLLLTNWHVIDAALPGGRRQASDFVCRFDYAATSKGTQPGREIRLASQWLVDSSPPSSGELGTGADAPSARTLDFALIRLAAPIGLEPSSTGGRRGWVDIRADQALPAAGQIVFVVQHPDGLPVKIGPGVTDGSTDALRFFHTANTMGGSSGSIVVDTRLVPIGLHHAGDALYRRGKIGAPERNQAVPIGLIAARLKSAGHLN